MSSRRQRLDISTRQAAALHRLLDAYLVTNEPSCEPGFDDLVAIYERIGRLEHDHTAYESP